MGGEEVVSVSEIVSVPDVWARVLLLGMSLDKRDPIVKE